jgi:hypothetical protein
LPDNLARFSSGNVRNGTGIKNVKVGHITRPNQPMPGPGKVTSHFFNFTYIQAAAY